MIAYRSCPAQDYAWPQDWRDKPAYVDLARHLQATAPDRLTAIIAGTDAKTNADLAKWRGLGRAGRAA